MNWKKYYEGKRAAEKIVNPRVSGSGYLRTASTPISTNQNYWYREYTTNTTVSTGY